MPARAWIFAACAALAGAAPLAGAEETPKPEPPKTEMKRLPGPFQVLGVSGPHAGRYYCPVCDYGLDPMVLVFVRDPADIDKPLQGFLKKVDELSTQHPDARLGGCVIVLNDGGYLEALESKLDNLAKAIDAKDALEAALKELAKAPDFNLQHVTLNLDTAAGPKDYNISPEASLTVLVVNKQLVVFRQTFTKEKPSEEQLEKIFQEVQKTTFEVEQSRRPLKTRRGR